ncbi:MAG TPA: ABC transporter permease, partial [Wenzhouxiangella sp.]|nr:ABC transporter permease [Wenzhouxiangella sp.]
MAELKTGNGLSWRGRKAGAVVERGSGDAKPDRGVAWRRWMQRLSWRVLTCYSIVFFTFIYLPLALIFVASFNANPVNMMAWDGFTFDWYRNIFGLETQLDETALYLESTDQLLAAVRTSIVVALTATAVSTVLGTATALAVYRFRFRLRRFYQMLMYMPMIMSDIVLGISLLIFFVGFGMSLSVTTIIIGHCTFLSSYVFIVVSARLAGMDGTYEEASADLGANEWTTFRRVTLPLIAPGVIGGAMLA